MVSVVFLVYFAILGVILVVVWMRLPRKLFSYQAVVKEKKVEYSTWLSADSFNFRTSAGRQPIPDHDYILYTEENQRVKTSQTYTNL